MKEILAILDAVDRVDVVALAFGVGYGFWLVIRALHAMERAITDKFHAHDVRITKLEVSRVQKLARE